MYCSVWLLRYTARARECHEQELVEGSKMEGRCWWSIGSVSWTPVPARALAAF